jgi:hypothetical protein
VNFLQRLRQRFNLPRDISSRLHRIQESLGRVEARQTRSTFDGDVIDAEFRVFSQWGEDGIIQALVDAIKPARRIFVEFGVQDYRESNTRFLLIHNNWSGLVIDGGQSNIEFIRNDPIYWQYNLKAECRFITRENINEILLRSGISGDIGLLSIDIDGNDYWVWQATTAIRPAIVVTEYNARFGPDRALSTPYAPDFVRSNAHYSGIYYGASLKAMNLLAEQRGYSLVGCNSAGNNAFFVRKDLMVPPLSEKTVADAFVPSNFREARSRDGNLSFLTADEEKELLASMDLVDISERTTLARS